MSESPVATTDSADAGPGSGAQFALRFLILFAVGSAAVWALEVAEHQGAISKLGESSARLVICSILLSALAISARRLERSVRFAVTLCIVFLGAELGFEILEDLRVISALFNGFWKHAIEKFIVACWTCAGFYLIYSLVNGLDKSNAALRIRDREMQTSHRELQAAMESLKLAQAQTIEHERMSALGRMASGVAHDLNNALTPVESLSRAMLEESIEFDREAMELVHLGAEHSINVVKNLQHFYRPVNTDEHEVVDLANVVQRTVALTKFRVSDSNGERGVTTEVRTRLEDNCLIRGNATELVQLVTNLVLNAIEAMDEGGEITVSTSRIGDEIKLQVADQGCGMTRGEIEQCIEPFYSGKEHGSGLGLSVCHGIARRHGAEMEIESCVEAGCQFAVRFPALRVPPPVEETKTTQPISVAGKKILCIDDNEWVRRGTQVLFSSTGVVIDCASDGPSGLELLDANDYDLLVTDLGMKEMSGCEVVARARSQHPQLRIAVVSGWSRDQVLEEFTDRTLPDFVLEKPLTVKAVHDCLTADCSHQGLA